LFGSNRVGLTGTGIEAGYGRLGEPGAAPESIATILQAAYGGA
jgi:hypothetical protein